MSHSTALFVAADIGGTQGRVALFEPGTDQPVPLARQVIEITNNYNADMTNLIQAIAACVRSCEATVFAIGVSLAGVPKPDGSGISAAGSLTDWVDEPVRNDLLEAFSDSRAVMLLGDAQAAALGEALYGAKPGGEVSGMYLGEDFYYVIWGTGIGGALVIYTEGFRPVARAGEPGHMYLGEIGVKDCGCGKRDCLESNVSGRAIDIYDGLLVSELYGETWEQTARLFAKGLRSVVAVTGVRHVVLGGGAAINLSESQFRVLLKEFQDMFAMWEVEIVRGPLGDDAGLYGAYGRYRQTMHGGR